jgi:hypothetical protein
MKEYDKKIQKRLGDLGDLLRSQPSITKNGMQKIKQLEEARPFKHVTFMPTLVKSGLGLAACLLIGAFLWFLISWPTSITLADVQKAIDSKTWIFIQYEDGAKQWANLSKRRSFYTRKDADGGNFYVGMRDHINGIWRCYHSNWGQQIHEETFTVRPYPQTPWEYAVGDWDDRGIGQFANKTVEKSIDTINDRKFVRFDTYNVGPLGIRSLAQQVWANPETRLPIRIRKYSRPDKFDTGDFSFPEAGPSSIYDLNAPQGLEIVNDWGITEPAAKIILDAAKEAVRQLPDKMRIVKKNKYGISISYRCGDKFRSESYGQIDPDHNRLLVLDFPQSNEKIRKWASDNLTLFDLCIFDGEYEYSYNTGDGLRDSSDKPEAKLRVDYHGKDWIDVLVPLQGHWPFTSNVGPMKVLEDEPGTPPGCVLLRYEGLGLRRNWYVDPKRDYICLKRLQFRKDQETDQFIMEKYWETERTDLTRLPSGQWYARTIINQGEKVIEYDVKLLTDAELENLAGKDDSEGFFNGKKLLKNAMDKGIKVTFWAR